jgi:hypothetical protein
MATEDSGRSSDAAGSSSRTRISDATAAASAAPSTVMNLIVDELLSYVGFHRNKSNADAIRRTVLTFYSPTDICQSKRILIGQFSSQLSTCTFVAERRNSSTRAAHEAEIDDILNIFDVLDLQNAPVDGKFVALNLDNIPKYGPEEINLASIVERQLRTEATVTDMTAAVEQIAANRLATACTPDLEATTRLVVELQQKLEVLLSVLVSIT